MEIWYIIKLSFISGCLELMVPKIVNWCSPSNRQLVARLTKEIVETYQICNPQFKYSEDLNPKRFLTSPSVGVLNDGYDNVNSDLILTVNFVLIHLEKNKRFVIHISFLCFMLSLYNEYQKLKCWFSVDTTLPIWQPSTSSLNFAFWCGADILSKISLATGHLDKWLNAGIQIPTVLLPWRSLKINLHTINRRWLK